MRVKFVVLALFMGCLVLLLGPTTGLTQFQGGSNRGGGGFQGGGFQFDPGMIFDRISNGRATINISEMPRGQEEMQAWAQKQGITNGQMTRDQFVSYSQSPEAQQARERMMAQFRGGGGRRPGGQATPGGSTPGGPAAPGGAPGGGPGGGRPAWAGGGDQNAWMDERFRRLDKDGDGYLSYEEMTENLKAEKDKWDTNKDGKIDLAEWREYLKAFAEQRRQESSGPGWPGAGGDNGPPADGSSEQAPKKPEPRKKVIVYRSGKLPPNIPAWFKEYDTDNDAQVALYEWKDKNRTVEDFQKLDLNGDGFITVEELIRSGAMGANTTTASAAGNAPDGTSPGSTLAMAPGGSQGGLGGRPGRGGGFGGFDMGTIFDRMAQGRSTINIADLQMGREEAQAWAQNKGITNGQLSREQFTSYMQERMQSWGRGGGQGSGIMPGGGMPGGGRGPNRGGRFGGGAPGGGFTPGADNAGGQNRGGRRRAGGGGGQ
ncbi:MAG: hypothetical protein HYS12_14625 [Planctomycetes bacterium]|nr:hypothetical protein [Planctomycetota bacterium]